MKFNIFDNDDRDCFESSGLVRKNYHGDLKNDLHVMKIIFPPEFYYGSRYHKTRDELYILVKGTLEITRFTKDTIEVIKLSKTGNTSYLCLSPEHHSVRNPSKKKKKNQQLYLKSVGAPLNLVIPLNIFFRRKSVHGNCLFFHDSSAAIIYDEKIICVAGEERFTRIKHDSSFPINGINFCLRKANIKAEHLKYVGFCGDPKLKFDRVTVGLLKQIFSRSFMSIKNIINDWANIKSEKIHNTPENL